MGDIIKSEIKSITDFGIFVGLDGGIDGLIHISDVTNIGKPEDFIRSYKKGESLESIVLSIDSDRERISLGIKQFIESNFTELTSKLKTGDIVDAKIVSISDTGVYMKIDGNVTASLKLLQKELKDILENETLKVSQNLKCNVKSIDKKNHQVICTLQDDSNRSDIINSVSKANNLNYSDIEFSIKKLIDFMSSNLYRGERIEIRGFGTFCSHSPF